MRVYHVISKLIGQKMIIIAGKSSLKWLKMWSLEKIASQIAKIWIFTNRNFITLASNKGFHKLKLHDNLIIHVSIISRSPLISLRCKDMATFQDGAGNCEGDYSAPPKHHPETRVESARSSNLGNSLEMSKTLEIGTNFQWISKCARFFQKTLPWINLPLMISFVFFCKDPYVPASLISYTASSTRTIGDSPKETLFVGFNSVICALPLLAKQFDSPLMMIYDRKQSWRLVDESSH